LAILKNVFIQFLSYAYLVSSAEQKFITAFFIQKTLYFYTHSTKIHSGQPMKQTFFALLLVSISFLSSCRNKVTTEETEKPTSDSLAPKEQVAETIIEGVYLCTQYGFELTIPASWKTKQPYNGESFEVFQKTSAGYDTKQKIKVHIPLLFMPIAEWEGHVKSDFSNYPYNAGGADPQEYARNNKYVFVIKNRWQMVFDDEATIKEIDAVLSTLKAVNLK